MLLLLILLMMILLLLLLLLLIMILLLLILLLMMMIQLLLLLLLLRIILLLLMMMRLVLMMILLLLLLLDLMPWKYWTYESNLAPPADTILTKHQNILQHYIDFLEVLVWHPSSGCKVVSGLQMAGRTGRRLWCDGHQIIARNDQTS